MQMRFFFLSNKYFPEFLTLDTWNSDQYEVAKQSPNSLTVTSSASKLSRILCNGLSSNSHRVFSCFSARFCKFNENDFLGQFSFSRSVLQGAEFHLNVQNSFLFF